MINYNKIKLKANMYLAIADEDHMIKIWNIW